MARPSALHVRPGTRDDAAALADFARRIFIETFAADNDPADFQRYLDEAFGVPQQTAELTSPHVRVLLGEADGALVAYALLRDDRRAACITGRAPLELQRFYVDRRLHGTGAAGSLMAAVLQTAREQNADTLWLGVWDRNARAIAFYRKHGFRDIGEQTFMMGSDRQTDRVMARPIRQDP